MSNKFEEHFGLLLVRMEGKVVSIGKTYIILERTNVGTILYVKKPEQFTKNEKVTVLVYKDPKIPHGYYAFQNVVNIYAFGKVLKQKGYGPKRAMDKIRRETWI